jgi:hypothetical protein
MDYHQHIDCTDCLEQWWSWVQQQSVKPIRGFEDKKNPDGSLYTYQQQQLATHMQMYLIICDMCSRGKSSASIHSIMEVFIKRDQDYFSSGFIRLSNVL